MHTQARTGKGRRRRRTLSLADAAVMLLSLSLSLSLCRFYLNQHSGHKLEWRYDQGQAEITVDFSKECRKALVVSTYQMMLLLVFNSFKLVTYKQLLDVTGIPKSEVANHLLSLCHPRVGVLLKRSAHMRSLALALSPCALAFASSQLYCLTSSALSAPLSLSRSLFCFFLVLTRRLWRTLTNSC